MALLTLNKLSILSSLFIAIIFSMDGYAFESSVGERTMKKISQQDVTFREVQSSPAPDFLAHLKTRFFCGSAEIELTENGMLHKETRAVCVNENATMLLSEWPFSLS